MISAVTGTELFYEVCRNLAAYGIATKRRGNDMWEFPSPVMLQLTEPGSYMCLHPERNLNPWVALAEFPWLMAGRSDIRWLLPYLPKAAQFSDDGMRWRAGYGPRLRAYGEGRVDQVAEVLRRLDADPTSRQAIISLWDPELDSVERSKDYPCTQTLHFWITGGRLHASTHMRSNDIVWGASGVNIPNFCLLQMYLASELGVGVGSYFHIADNLHAYGRHAGMVGEVVDAGGILGPPAPTADFSCHEVSHFAEAVYAVEHARQRHDRPFTLHDMRDRINHQMPLASYLPQWAYFMLIHDMVHDTPRRRHLQDQGATYLEDTLSNTVAELSMPQWRTALAMYLERNVTDLGAAGQAVAAEIRAR